MDLNKDGRVVYMVCAIASSGWAFTTGSASAFIIKFDGTTGTILRSMRFNGNKESYPNAIKVDAYGSIIMTIHTIT